jgi:hypothetical protein
MVAHFESDRHKKWLLFPKPDFKFLAHDQKILFDSKTWNGLLVLK